MRIFEIAVLFQSWYGRGSRSNRCVRAIDAFTQFLTNNDITNLEFAQAMTDEKEADTLENTC